MASKKWPSTPIFIYYLLQFLPIKSVFGCSMVTVILQEIVNYSSLPNSHDATAINFLRIFHPHLLFQPSRLFKMANFASPCRFQASCLLKPRNQAVELPTTLLFQPPHHSSLQKAYNFHIKIKCTRKNKSFEYGIVINCFENIYCQIHIPLNTGVLLIRFNSIE